LIKRSVADNFLKIKNAYGINVRFGPGRCFRIDLMKMKSILSSKSKKSINSRFKVTFWLFENCFVSNDVNLLLKTV